MKDGLRREVIDKTESTEGTLMTKHKTGEATAVIQIFSVTPNIYS